MASSRQLKIFLADDDDDDREFFHEALNSIDFNCELITVNNGEKVINFFSGNHPLPDLIFLDINMPKKNGLECLKFIRSTHPTGNFHIIMLSTSSATSIVDMSYRYGASIYIQKPSRFKELVMYLNYCISELKSACPRRDFLLNDRLKKIAH